MLPEGITAFWSAWGDTRKTVLVLNFFFFQIFFLKTLVEIAAESVDPSMPNQIFHIFILKIVLNGIDVVCQVQKWWCSFWI